MGHLKRLALAEEELSSAWADVELAKLEAESAREALSRAIEDFKNLKEFKEEILEGGFASYCVGYEDSQDIIEKLYPNLNLSSIVRLGSKDEAAEEDTVSAGRRTLTPPPEVVQIPKATLEQRDKDDDKV